MYAVAKKLTDNEQKYVITARKELLTVLFHEALLLRKGSRHNIYFELWRDSARKILKAFYGGESGELEQFKAIRYVPAGRAFSDSALCRTVFDEGMKKAAELLLLYIRKIDSPEHHDAHEQRFDIISDVRKFTDTLALPEEYRRQAVKELEELCAAGDETGDVSGEDKDEEIRMNKAIKILHGFVRAHDIFH